MGGVKNDEKNLKGKVCPVHGCSLQKYDTGAVDAWYCGKCDRYYLDPVFQNSTGKIMILGKETSFFPQSDLHAEVEEVDTAMTNRVPSSKKDRLDYAEANLKGLPLASKIQFCPVHKTKLDTRLSVVSGNNGWEKILSIGLCRDCALLFTNDTSVCTQSSPSAFGVPVIWNPKIFKKYGNGKEKEPIFYEMCAVLHNAPVHIQKVVHTNKKAMLTEATDQIITPDGHKIVIQGWYSARYHRFICALKNYLKNVSPEYDSYIVRVDPSSLIIKSRKNQKRAENQQIQKSGLKQQEQQQKRETLLINHKNESETNIQRLHKTNVKQQKQEQEQKRKRLEQSALPYLCYTLPLLKGNTNQCPFCKNALVSDRVMRIAIYKNQKMDMAALQRGLYCPHCEVPFIDRTLEDQLLLKLKPKMIYVFDANACRTPRELLERAKEKFLVRKPKAQNQKQAQPINAAETGTHQRTIKKDEWKLTPLALASIGAIDDFYDLYAEVQRIYAIVWNEQFEVRGTSNNYFPEFWDRDARKRVKNACIPIIKKHGTLFLGEKNTKPLFINAEGFKPFSFLKVTIRPEFDISVEFKSFADFLIEIQFAVVRSLFIRRGKDNPDLAFGVVFDEINYNITKYTEDHSLVRISPISDHAEQDICPVLYIYENLSSVGCRLKGHLIVPTTCVVNFLSGNGEIILPVHYCEDCRKYFIGKTTLKLFEKTYGKFRIKKKKIDANEDPFNLNKESILFQLGYNVSDGRSEMERQKLLAFLLESRSVSYLEMVRCIEFNIQMHTNHKEAIVKWKRDLKYIGDYVIQKFH